MYTVKEIADMAGVSVRTLHYYDEIDLLKPTRTGDNGYRYYGEDAVLRLQQILFYREMDLELAQIREVLDAGDFDLLSALQAHRHTFREKIRRLERLTQTVDATILHVVGEIDMSEQQIFDGFSEEKQQQYEKEALERWGDSAAQSIKLWNSYSEERKAEIMLEGNNIYQAIAANMDKGATSPEIQSLLVRWHEHLRNFYEPAIETLQGLGNMYHDHPDFNATFTRMDPRLPAFLKEAIGHYVDGLEPK